MALSPGGMLPHYRLVEQIGEGGMGVVWSADDTVLGRQVAIKVLPDDFAQDQERLGRFKQEARLLAALNHSNIAAIYGLEESDGVRYLVLELVPGLTLAERIGRGPLPVDEALTVCCQIAEARTLPRVNSSPSLANRLCRIRISIDPVGRSWPIPDHEGHAEQRSLQ
ncbi:MAG: protein kinase [Acidobacteria bacterium]|nr:protein kinase [Acidobacteriota bacterium]